MKSQGSVDVVAGMMFLLIIVLSAIFGFRTIQYMVISAEVEDALTVSNLASAIIDIEEYGKSHNIHIRDSERAFSMYYDALCSNLKLDTQLNTTNKDLLVGRVEIKEYILYNRRNGEIETIVMNQEGKIISCSLGQVGSVYTPNQVCIENTSVYSRIGFYVEGFAGKKIYGEKEKCIDIARWNFE